MKLSRKNHSWAFTLLEIMVALALLAVIVTAIYSSWNAILRGSKVALDVAAASQRARITMSTLHDSLLNACLFNENARYYAFVADADGDFSSLSFVARLPKTFPRSGKFGDLDLRRVSFTIEEGPLSKKQLVLRQNPILMEPDRDEVETPLVLARDVSKFVVEFLDAQKGEYVTAWTLTNQLPKMVKISLELGKLDQFSSQPQEAMFSTVVLPAQGVRREWQLPTLGVAPGMLNSNLVPQPGGTGAGSNPGGRGSMPGSPM
jgi:prepilin-type N-terminal cleavage/methylation domain-containing protein